MTTTTVTSIYDCSVINLFLDIQNLNKIANVYVFYFNLPLVACDAERKLFC